MADKPIYYGGTPKSSPMYYGGTPKTGPMYGGNSKGPMYYGGRPGYVGMEYGGAYGSYGGVAPASGGEEVSMVGTITPGRILRVISQRWLSVFVFLLVGLIVSFAVYKVSPTIYEATSEFTLDMRRMTAQNSAALSEVTPEYGSTYIEIFNTRLSDWRSKKIVTMIVQQYRSSHPASTTTDEEIISTLTDSTLELQRNSRIITIAVRSKSAKLAAHLANAYAEAIEQFTDEENKARCDKAVRQIHENAEKARRDKDKLAKTMMDFRTANKVDILRSKSDTLKQGYSKTTGDILALEAEETQLVEYEKLLASVEQNPETFASLSSNVPRAEEIATEYRAFQDAAGNCAKLEMMFTENHPDVQAAKAQLNLAKGRFIAATKRALLTSRSTLQVVRNQLTVLRQKQEDLRSESASIEQRIVLAESSLSTYESDLEIANKVLEGLLFDENKARLDAQSNNEIVRVGRLADEPKTPVLPNPMMIFGIGVALSLALGLLFVLVMDNLEDTIVNLSDIEGRLALKVLAVFPHVRRKKREQVAKFAVEDKYSQFSEAVAGLRNLLDSPRYEAMSHCMIVISTQPGEGKTITSTSIAISYAQAGRKVLHVDFDMRRPRLARVWGIDLTLDRSFSHVLQNANQVKPDFAKLVNKSSVEGLDVICSLPPDGVSPSTILGSAAVADFFEWARANYDRVIIDSPPYGVVGDVVTLSVMVDSVIIMCCPDRTHFKPIQYCSRCLTEAGANILGVIVNDVEVSGASAFSPSVHHSYGYGAGYGYGYGYRPANEGDGDNSKSKVKGDKTKKIEAEIDHEEFTDED